MEYYTNNLNYITEYDKNHNFPLIQFILFLILFIFLVLVLNIEIFSYKEYYAVAVNDQNNWLLLSNVKVEDTFELLESKYVEIDDAKIRINATKVDYSSDNISYNILISDIDNSIDLQENIVIKVKYLYKKEKIINKVKKIFM